MTNIPHYSINDLCNVTSLLIKQKVKSIEVILGVEVENKYHVFDNFGRLLFLAFERSNFWARNCLGSQRAFEIFVTNPLSAVCFVCEREYTCCCAETVTVKSPFQQPIATVDRNFPPICKPDFTVKDALNKPILKIRGPVITSSIFGGDVVFKIFSAAAPSVQIGKITKKYSGFFKEAFTDADNFSIEMPFDLDVRFKAALLGATFLIDFVFYESERQR
ncbi:unnamed protein product [Gordionus sp. m RMFG-2023]|uniref:phospholipid scramblase 1-like isoform X2 n=1 Tax=Gordionus sp. m RMFG-2023 TaxID=3053472 RepID=UPI0030DF6B9D